jgi:hypothetical protein
MPRKQYHGIDKVIEKAKAIVYKDIYIPKKLRKKIKIVVTKTGKVIIKNKN